MWVSDTQILDSVRSSLVRLSADLAGTSAAAPLVRINIALGELAARADNRHDSLRQSCMEAQRIAAQGADLVAKIGAGDLSACAKALPEAAQVALADVDASYKLAKQLMVDCILPINHALNSGKGDDVWRAQVKAFFFAVADHDKRRAQQDAHVPPLPETNAGQSLDVEALKKYFAHFKGTKHLPGPLELIETNPLSGGFSRQTILIKVRDGSGKTIPLVIRKQIPNGFLDGACNALFEETPFFRLCNQHRLPVPELLWHERDTSIIGGEFFITECMPGKTIGTSYQMATGIGDAFFQQLAQYLAAQHAIDWTPFAADLLASSRIPEGAEVTSHQAALSMVDQFESYWRKASLDPLPSYEIMVDWLKHNVPHTERKAALCHGDIGFHNMLVEDGQIKAVLDWETSRLGDPARDLSYIRPMVTHYVDWQKFIGWYRAAGGPEIDEASLAYYDVFCAFAHVIVCEVAMGDTFPRSGNADLGYLHLGIPIKAYFFDEVLRFGAPIWGSK